jgi:RimJ/RimL family protein N-acetyltransferase
MAKHPGTVFETERLVVRKATGDDVNFYYELWTHPDVMRHVGFPQGLPITKAELRERLVGEPASEFDRLLVVEKKATGEAIGECKLAQPDEDGISEPDIKLLPEHWGRGYGSEIWRALVAYQFNHTDCEAVQTTPNVNNPAAIQLYESAGAGRVDERVYHFPEAMQAFTTPVHSYVYRLYRADWRNRAVDD